MKRRSTKIIRLLFTIVTLLLLVVYLMMGKTDLLVDSKVFFKFVRGHFFSGKGKNVSDQKNYRIWPEERIFDSDGIMELFLYMPKSYKKKLNRHEIPREKLIYVATQFDDYRVEAGNAVFHRCPVNACSITYDKARIPEADVVAFHEKVVGLPQYKRPASQVWVLQMSESPQLGYSFSAVKGLINWTCSYRHDSTIVAPYGTFILFSRKVRARRQSRNYASGRTGKVAWAVSNCKTPNQRLEYVRELARHIQVDIYGRCGDSVCPGGDSAECFRALSKHYKFYLSFENSNCRDYITEKFFQNALKNDIVPVVMGAAPEDYQRVAPPHSYVHVDSFDSPRDLASYLHRLDRNDSLYNEYFQWKGTGFFVGDAGGIYVGYTFFCHVCAMTHDESKPAIWYDDVDTWWRTEGVCTSSASWKGVKRKKGISKD